MTDRIASPAIRIRGARTHNLQNVNVDLPLGKLIVVTGVSGSGKSSLAFDTLFAEGQRRYLECVSVHTRNLLKQLPHPEVDEVSGLPPTVSVDQRVNAMPARSTLAVTTEIYDYLRLLYARAGTAHCTGCGNAVESQSVNQIVDRIMRRPERTKLMVMSPMVRFRRGAHKDVLERIGRNGFVRVRVDGELLDISDVPALSARKEHSIDAVIDRIILKQGIAQRLRESIDLAVRESDGTCIICEDVDGEWHDRLFSTKFSCADCEGFGIRGLVDEVDDVTVFRHAPCTTCDGSRLQPFSRGITFLGKTIADFTAQSVDEAIDVIEQWLRHLDQSDTPGEPDGTADTFRLPMEAMLVAKRTLPDIQRRLRCLQQVGVGYLTLNRATRTLSGGEFQRARLAACLGIGLHGACFVLDEPTSGLHPRDTQKLLATLNSIRDAGATVVVVEHDGEVMKAADHLVDLGPGAGVEGGRVLYSGPIAEASGTDSPTGAFLRDELNAYLDSKDAVSSSAEIESVSRTLSKQVDLVDNNCAADQLLIRNARKNNLQGLTVGIPLKQLVCITGVSGSGKSSLITETLLPVAAAHFHADRDIRVALADAECDGIDGLQQLKRLVAVDSSPLGKNRRSCIATYSGLWNEVRKVFAKTKDARAKGFTARRFSFNSGDGRCATCKGTGVQDLRMAFLPDTTIPCPDCDGSRFNKATLTVRFAEKNVADVLTMRVDEAVEFFNEFDSLRHLLHTFRRLGLGYLTLGQPASSYSGGEAQRIKLATELAASRDESTLFLLDEPTSGLHPADVNYLIRVLRDLVNHSHSVVVVEHNVDVMLASDWMVDIGPESAACGGKLVAQGTPVYVMTSGTGLTASVLQTGRTGRSGHGNENRT